jgi:hypothetical protein
VKFCFGLDWAAIAINEAMNAILRVKCCNGIYLGERNLLRVINRLHCNSDLVSSEDKSSSGWRCIMKWFLKAPLMWIFQYNCDTHPYQTGLRMVINLNERKSNMHTLMGSSFDVSHNADCTRYDRFIKIIP